MTEQRRLAAIVPPDADHFVIVAFVHSREVAHLTDPEIRYFISSPPPPAAAFLAALRLVQLPL
jgi:hypothetical protein